MQRKPYIFFLTILLITCNITLLFGWGYWAHQRINRAAVFALPDSMGVFFYNHIDFITEEAVMPDVRIYAINYREEANRHYIDLEMLPDTIPLLTQMAADSADNTFTIPFEMWREVFINDGEPDLVQRAYAQLSPEPFGPWAEPLKMAKFPFAANSTQLPCRGRRLGDAARRFGLASPHVKPARRVPVGPDAGKPRGGLHKPNRPC